jgi:GT2 family glycosyltransferase
MHRSGTSALTRCLNLLGLTLGREDHLIPAGPDNLRGFWENAGLSQLNEKILEQMGGSWCVPPFLHGPWWGSARLEALRIEARQLLASEGLGGPQACWKDPRSCLTLPLWLDLLPGPPAVVFIHRSPLEIWKSLEKRNGFNKRTALALWTVYSYAALVHIAGLAVFTLSYEQLLKEPMSWLGRIKDFLERNGVSGLAAPDPAAVSGFLSSELRNWRSRSEEFEADPETLPVQRRLFELLACLPEESERFPDMERPAATELFECHAAASEAQIATLLAEIEKARTYQAGLEDHIHTLEFVVAGLRHPRVDIMVVNYNGRRWIDGFMQSLQRSDYPAGRLRLVFVDNASRDDSLAYARQRAAELPFPSVFEQTGQNTGFTGGYARAFERGDADYYFVINTDTAMATDAISRLVGALEADPQIGIAEARQSPQEHPKYFDPISRETSWCSGACMMVRERALRTIGGKFEPSFFAYAEDVDLSWRMWLHGWKCVYVREAVVEHFTEHLDPDRDHSVQHYFSMRNGALMRVMYGSVSEALLYYAAMLRVGTLSRNPRWHKWLTMKAMAVSLRKLPRALRRRRGLRRLGRHPWVFFNGWLYGRHQRDPATTDALERECIMDLPALWAVARRELAHDLPLDQHIVCIPNASVGGTTRSAVLVYDTGRLHLDVPIPVGSLLSGAITAPQDAWKPTASGSFEILQDGRSIWRQVLDLSNPLHRQWVPFEAALEPTEAERKSRVTLCFEGEKDLVWGLWGQVEVTRIQDNRVCDRWVNAQTGVIVSVVIPTHNRADGIERVVRRLMAQDVPPERFEVILVDSNSSDDTPAAVDRLAACYPNVTALRSDLPGAAAARNLGLEAARGDLIVLLDDDILVGGDFLRQFLRAMHKHADCVLLGRIVTPWEGSCDPFHRYLLQVQDVNVYDFPDQSNVPANYFYTACVGIPREVLGQKRFDEGFRVYGVEDVEFGFRLLAGDARMVYLPYLQVLHDYYPSFGAYRRKKHKAGYSLGYFLAQHPEHAHRFQFGARFRKYYPLLRVLRTLGWPVASLLRLGERLLYREGPVNRPLYWWWYTDLRIQLYSGLWRYRRGKPPPS